MHVSRRQLGLLAIAATVNSSLPFLLISWGEVSVPSGLASVLNSTVPIFSVLIAAVVLRDEPLTVPKAGAVAVGFGGVVLLLSRDLAHGGLHWSAVLGEAAIVLSSLCYAVGAVFTRQNLRDVPPLTIATYAVPIAAAESLLISVLFAPPHLAHVGPKVVVAVLWLGILGTGLAYSLSYYVLSHWGASRYSMVAYMLPSVGLLLGVIVLHEALDWRIAAGSLLVIASVALASVRRLPWISRPAARPVST
jgi:drug/metabolite transporter (DMT)-like permease